MPASFEIGDDLDARRRRARYRAWHRGTRELDLILGAYADAHLPDITPADLGAFEQLLESEEVPLQRMLVGQDDIPDGPLAGLISHIRDFQLRRSRERAND